MKSLKKIATITLLVILVFNWYGYRLLEIYMSGHADQLMQSTLDRRAYDESLLITIKVPANYLSGYINHSDQFVRVDGHIEINTHMYSYVKKRLYHDSIEMLCLPNLYAEKFQKAGNDFFKLVSDVTHPAQEKKTNTQGGKIFAEEYDVHPHDLQLITAVVFANKAFADFKEKISSGSRDGDEKPPDFL